MKTMLQNFLAFAAGLAAGSAVNMSIIMVSGAVIAPPVGADLTTMEGLQEAMHLFEPKHYLMPFLAHALGTFAGAWVAALIAVNYKMIFALGISVFFLAGGIINVIILPSPTWFSVLDLTAAYIPMGYLAGWLAMKYSDKNNP